MGYLRKKLVTVLLWSLLLSNTIFSDDIRNILLLNSYNQNMTWVSDLVQGVEEGLKPLAAGLNLHIENMDTKVFNHEDYIEAFRRTLEVKYRDMDISLIMSSDNNAYNFLRLYRDSLFPGVPVVFCGVNDFKQNQIDGLSQFTGVAEIFSARETVELMLNLHSKTEEIYIINDYLVTGRAWKRDIQAELAYLDGDIEIRYSGDLPIDELKNDISRLEEGALVLLGVYFADRDNYHNTYEQIGEELAAASNVPVYCLLGFNVRAGVVGGCVISGYNQGKFMAEMALDILRGADPAAMAVRLQGSNQYVFDFREMDRFSIDEKDVPEGSLLLNLPDTFWRRNRKEVLIAAVFVSLLIIAIIVLIYNYKRQSDLKIELKHFQKYLINIINNIPVLLICVDENMFVTLWNSGAERETGITWDNASGKKLFQVFPRIRSEKERILESIEGDAIFSEKRIRASREGETIQEILTIIPLKENGSKGAVIKVEDITEQVMIEEALIQSEKMLTVGGLAAGMAHEINNPLAGMMQSAEVLRKRLVDEPEMASNRKVAEEIGLSLSLMEVFLRERGIDRLIDSIRTSGRQAAEIVHNMLSFSRIDKDRNSTCDLIELFEKTLELASSDYSLLSHSDFRNIRIEREFSDGLPSVICERTKIQQVILNILKNGAEAMFEASIGEPRFIIRLYKEKEKNQICLEIEDNGPGMSEEVKKRIFDPFFTTKPVGVGTGLGLSVSYFIIRENHKGEMWVDSSPGHGTCFTITLPL